MRLSPFERLALIHELTTSALELLDPILPIDAYFLMLSRRLELPLISIWNHQEGIKLEAASGLSQTTPQKLDWESLLRNPHQVFPTEASGLSVWSAKLGPETSPYHWLVLNQRPLHSRMIEILEQLGQVIFKIMHHRQLELAPQSSASEQELAQSQSISQSVSPNPPQLTSPTEKKLRESKARLEMMLEHLQVGVLLESFDRKILSINMPLLELFKLPQDPDAWVNQPGEQLTQEAAIIFEQPDALKQHTRECLSQAKKRLAETFLLADGRYLQRDYIPILFRQKLMGHLWVYSDVSEKYEAEKENQILSLFPQENPNPVMRIDANGKVQYANVPARYLLNYWQRDVDDFVPGFIQDVLKKSLASGQAWKEEVVFGKRYYQVVLFPFPNRDYVNLYATDITERRQAEQDALEARDTALKASEAKSDFLAVMSHEIRTPLNAILGMLEVLSQGNLDATQHEYVNTSRDAGRNLLELINHLLDFSRIEAGLMDLEQTPFQIRPLIKKTFAIFHLRAKDKGLSLESDLPETVPLWLKGDGRRLSQVLFILIDNALKFTQQGKIKVQVLYAEPTGDFWQLCLCVKDTGVGIAKEKQEIIFESFQQADSSTTREYGGSGLGLSIARQLVELFGGKMWLESEANQGSQFFFTLRLLSPSAEEIQQAEQETYVYEPQAFQQKWKAQPKTVLVVEDSPENRLLIQAFLKKMPLHLEFAFNGEEAIQKRFEINPDLILMDIQMPVLDGLSATLQIRQQELESNSKPVPIIALTADALNKTREACFEVGCNGFLTKPIEQSLLLQAMDKQLHFIEDLMHEHDDPALLESDPKIDIESATPDQKLNSELNDWPDFKIHQQFKDILPLFIQLREEEPPKIRELLESNDLKDIERIGHSLKGVGGSFGFPYVSEIGERLENAAIDNQGPEMLACAQTLEDYIIWAKALLIEQGELISEA